MTKHLTHAVAMEAAAVRPPSCKQDCYQQAWQRMDQNGQIHTNTLYLLAKRGNQKAYRYPYLRIRSLFQFI